MADNSDTGALCRRDIDTSIRVAVGALAVESVCPLDFPDFAHESSLALIHEFNQIAASLAEAASLSFKSLAASLVAEFCAGGEQLSTRSQLASRIAPLEQHFHTLRRSLLLHFLPGWIGELGCEKCMSGDAGGGSCSSSSASSSAISSATTGDSACFDSEGPLAPERRSSRLSALGTRLRMSKHSESDESDQSDTDGRNEEAPDREEEQEEPESKPSRSRRSSKRRKRANGYEESSGARNSLPKAATHILKQWLFSHFEKPYPTDDEKLQLSAQTGLSVLQINYYFINARVRIWKPMLANLSNSASKKGAGNVKSK